MGEVTGRFKLAKVGDQWIVWDSEERMVVDEDWERAELVDLVSAMNSLDIKLNHNFVQ